MKKTIIYHKNKRETQIFYEHFRQGARELKAAINKKGDGLMNLDDLINELTTNSETQPKSDQETISDTILKEILEEEGIA